MKCQCCKGLLTNGKCFNKTCQNPTGRGRVLTPEDFMADQMAAQQSQSADALHDLRFTEY